MIGVIIKHGPHLVVVTAESVEHAEHIALELFSTVGLELEGQVLSMLVFDPAERGGIIVRADEEIGPVSPDMTGWTPDGFTG